MKKLDILGTIMLLMGNLALIVAVCILLSVDFRLEMFHIIALVTGVGGIIETVLSFVIAILVGVEKENEQL